MIASKSRSNPDQQVLLIVEATDEQRTDRSVLIEAGYPEEAILTVDAEDAFSILFGGEQERGTRRPSLVIVDLDHTREPGRALLDRLIATLKQNDGYRIIPILLLVREDSHENVPGWYKTGINAVAVRPDRHDEMVSFFKSVRAFWSENVTLADDLWP